MVVRGGPTFTREVVGGCQHGGVAGVRQEQSSLCRRHADADMQRVIAAAEDDAAERADIAVITPPGERYMAMGRQDVVGRIQIYPAQPWTPDREPSMRGIGTHEQRLSGRRLGQEVAADVACGEPERSQAADL